MRQVLGVAGVVELTADEYRSIVVAKRGLVTALGIEEKFNMLRENFVEYELALLERCLQRLVFPDDSWSSFQDDIYTVNRRLVNFLSAARLYLDHCDHALSDLGDHGLAAREAFSHRRSSEYDTHLAYRAMEAVRNIAQHRSLPIERLSFNGSREEADGATWVRHTIVPALDIQELGSGSRFKGSIVEELKKEARGKHVAVTPLVREYVEGLGRVHQAVRACLMDDVQAWDGQMTEAINRARAAFGDNTGLAVVRLQDEEELDAEQLFGDLIKRRKYLERRNRRAASVVRHYVSGKVKADDS